MQENIYLKLIQFKDLSNLSAFFGIVLIIFRKTDVHCPNYQYCVEVVLVLTSLGLLAVPFGFLLVPLVECPYSVFKYVTTFSDKSPCLRNFINMFPYYSAP